MPTSYTLYIRTLDFQLDRKTGSEYTDYRYHDSKTRSIRQNNRTIWSIDAGTVHSTISE